MKFFSVVVLFTLFSSFYYELGFAATPPPEPVTLSTKHQKLGYKVALLAGGCFWCLEPPYENLKGVIEASVGYCGGKAKNAKYYQVSNGNTSHLETVRIVYDPKNVSYRELLDIYWRFIDPTDEGGQYDDRGDQYTTAIFYHDELQQQEAERSKTALIASRGGKKPIITRILPARPFYLAEPRHQNFYEKRYSHSKKVTKEQKTSP